jgi:hypothetical protein
VKKLPEKDLVTAATEEMLTEPELIHFERLVRNTLCIMRCKRRIFGKNRVERIQDKKILVQQFEGKQIYNYLQLCYFQVRKSFSSRVSL